MNWSEIFTKRNIATFLITGILVLSIPFGLKLSESQKTVSSQAAEGICLDPTHMDHAPLYPISFYSVIEDSDEGNCQTVCTGTDAAGNPTGCSRKKMDNYQGAKDCGFIWTPSVGKLHLKLWDASKLGSCPEQDKSFCSDAYYSVINDPNFPIAVALINKMFRLDVTNYIFAVSNPALGGRGDDRAFDPAFNVASFLDATSGGFFHQLNPNNIHDPVEWLYDRGFWARPTSGTGSTPRPGVASPQATGRAFQEEYYGHYQRSIDNNPRGHIGMTSDKKSIIDVIKQKNLRQKNWTELACTNQPPVPGNGSTCTSINAPSTVSVGQSFNVTVTMNNPANPGAGKPWTTSENYRLGRWDTPTNNGWILPEVNGDRVSLPSSPINAGSSANFSFQVTAPTTPGTKTLELRMVQDGVEWFGGICSKLINITSSSPSPSPSSSARSSTSPSPSSSTTLTCDFNKDGIYDDKDFNIWRDEFTGQKRTLKADCAGNPDGSPDLKVDLVDFNKWRDEKINRE